jgi:predicted ATPase with chaperone activity
VLLLDELEQGIVAVASAWGHAVFPARFQLVGTFNV